jgi:hypothetical protein
MHLPLVAGLVGIFLLWIVPGQAGTLEKAPVNVEPSVNTSSPWEITVEGPGWLVICPRNNISYKLAMAASQALLILRNTSVPLARHT